MRLNSGRSGSRKVPNEAFIKRFGTPIGLLFGLLMVLASESPQLPRETRIPLVQAGTLWIMALTVQSFIQ